MNRYLSAICHGYKLFVFTTLICTCSNRLKSKMVAFLVCFKIYCFHTILFPKALCKWEYQASQHLIASNESTKAPSKTATSRPATSNQAAFDGPAFERGQCLTHMHQGDPFLTSCSKVLLLAFVLMQFDAVISNMASVFQISEKNAVIGRFESKFWPILTVLVIGTVRSSAS